MQAQPPQLQGAGAPGAAAGGAPCFDIAEAPGSPALLLGGLLQQRHHQHQQHAAQPVWLHATPSAAAAAGRPLASGAAAQRLREGLPSLHAPRSLNSAALGGSDVDEQQPEQQQQRPEERPPHEASGSSGAAERASWGRRLRRLAIRVGDLTQPSGEAPGDATWGERAANVLTSLPFLALGLHMHRQRLTPEGRAHARTLVAVGAAATAYHATSGAARRLARKVDYWAIAYSSSALVRCIYADSPVVRRAASLSLLAVPFRPFAVSTANALAMQAEFLRQAVAHKAVRADLRRHYAAAALGVAAFFAEDLVQDSGWSGYVHSAWHCLACYGTATTGGLIAHKERQQLQAQLARQAGAGAPAGLPPGAKPLRRPLHSSASSLPSYGSGGYPGAWRGQAAGDSPLGWSPAGGSPRGLSPPPRPASP